MTDSTLSTVFGSGGAEPYERVLQGLARGLLLRDPTASRPDAPVNVARFLGKADATERRLVRSHSGPLLDIGCGPGRMLQAARQARRVALGIDVSAASVAIATTRGLLALRRSVFEELPGEGGWHTALLLDGNIGIGGDPVNLLARCAQLVQPGGAVVVETHADPARDARFDSVVVDDSGAASDAFPWAETGCVALRSHAQAAGLSTHREWRSHGRWFAEYRR